jgi:hypothetical protein
MADETPDSPTDPEPSFNFTIKQFLHRQRHSLAATGFISLANSTITSLRGLGSQPHLTLLDISNTKLDSLDSLPLQPWITEILANGTQIANYKGFSRHPQLRKLSLLNTPLSQRPNFRLFTLLAVGPKLLFINSEPIYKSDREQTTQFPRIARLLLEAGCEIPETDPDYRRLADEVSLKIDGVLWSELPRRRLRSWFGVPLVFLPKSKDEDSDKAQELTESRQIELERDEDLVDDELAVSIAEILQKIEIFVGTGPQAKEAILEALTGLVHVVQPLDRCATILLPEASEVTEVIE